MKKYIPIFVVIFILSFYLVSQGVFNTGDPTAGPVSHSKKLQKHYDETIRNIKFETFNSKTVHFKKPPKVLIVNFWASWCTPCLEEFPSLNKLLEKYNNDGVEVVGINTDEKDQLNMIKKIKKKYSLNFPIVADKDGKLINDFLIDAIPKSIVFNKGKMVELSKGSKDFYSEEFREKVDVWIK